MESVNGLIAKQYTEYAYPEPIADLDHYHKNGTTYVVDPIVSPGLLWPEGSKAADLKILVAGCGTNQAAIYAYKNPKCQIYGLDLSETSLAHEKYLMEKHSLGNLLLIRGDVLNVKQLGEEFDLIVCTGVLHHMKDPLAGLSALSGVLDEDGTIHAMLYAKIARTGVYLLQSLFQQLGLSQTQKDIEFVREVLTKIPRDHPAWYFANNVTDVSYDAGLVDLFLNASDVSFDVPELLRLVSQSGLSFQGWVDNSRYYPDSLFGNTSVAKLISRLPLHEQWEAVEKVRMPYSLHDFVLCHPEKARKRQISFEGEAWLTYFPSRVITLNVERRQEAGESVWSLSRAEISFTLPETSFFVLQLSDGSRSISEICNELSCRYGLSADIKQFVKNVCKSMYERGHIYISKVASKVPQKSSWAE